MRAEPHTDTTHLCSFELRTRQKIGKCICGVMEELTLLKSIVFAQKCSLAYYLLHDKSALWCAPYMTFSLPHRWRITNVSPQREDKYQQKVQERKHDVLVMPQTRHRYLCHTVTNSWHANRTLASAGLEVSFCWNLIDWNGVETLRLERHVFVKGCREWTSRCGGFAILLHVQGIKDSHLWRQVGYPEVWGGFNPTIS